MKKKNLIFDTNFLVYYAKQKKFDEIDYLIRRYNCFILDACIKEIKKLIRGRHAAKVEMMLNKINDLIAEGRIKLIKVETTADKGIVMLAEEKMINVLASFDKRLIKKIKAIDPSIEVIKSKFD